jgi:hypothetical protein
MKKTAQNTQENTYEMKLNGLLDSCTFYKNEDGCYMTQREIFEDNFKMLVESPLKYFSIQRHKLDSEDLQTYSKAGGGVAGAYAVIKESIELLNGNTLDYTSTEDKNTLDLNKAIINNINRGVADPIRLLKTFSTEKKYQILNALLYANEYGYFIEEPNMLMKNYKVEFDDIAHFIESKPSWSYGADGFVAQTHLIVNQDKVIELFDKYPLFNLKFTKEILQDITECSYKDIQRAIKDYEDLYNADEQVTKFFTSVLLQIEA